MVIFRVSIYPIDLDRCEIFDIETLPAVVADLIGIEVADLALHAVVAVLRFIQNTFDSFHSVHLFCYYTLPWRK